MKTSLSRRGLLRAGGFGLAVAALETVIPESLADPLGIPIGLQLYTVHRELRKDFAGTLRQVAAIGIRDVELIAFPDRKPSEVLRALREAGLRPVSTHTGGEDLASGARKQIEDAGELGVKYLICADPAPAAGSRMTLGDWHRNADLFNKVGEQAKNAGIQFGYHNHDIEFASVDGVTPYDELLKCTDPQLVTMEMDCGWVESAGADAAGYLQKNPGRVQLLHVKDIKRRGSPGVEFDISSTEVGKGIIDWQRIFSAAKQGGVRHYFIEQEPPFERPAIDAVRMSYDWLHAMKG